MLRMAFDLAAQGKSDREIAQALNIAGCRTTGTHGSRPFSKDTVKDMLTNRFYIGYIPDGNGGWINGKHEPMINEELFNAAQRARERRCRVRNTINVKARTYSLSGLMRSAKCGSKMRIQQNPKGEPRVYCAGRAQAYAIIVAREYGIPCVGGTLKATKKIKTEMRVNAMAQMG
jgi:hypothetical protein